MVQGESASLQHSNADQLETAKPALTSRFEQVPERKLGRV